METCFFVVVFFYIGVHQASSECNSSSILQFVCETPAFSHRLESVTRAYMDKVLSSKWVKVKFWGELDFFNQIRCVCFPQINFLIFIHIIKILVSKLRAHQMRYTDYKFRWVQASASAVCLRLCSAPRFFCWFSLSSPPSLHLRLAKSTLTLIPLLGIHQVVFIFLTDESTKASSSLRLTKLFTDLFFSSFQVERKRPLLFLTLWLRSGLGAQHHHDSGVSAC